jgi:hypothetical protein
MKIGRFLLPGFLTDVTNLTRSIPAEGFALYWTEVIGGFEPLYRYGSRDAPVLDFEQYDRAPLGEVVAAVFPILQEEPL